MCECINEYFYWCDYENFGKTIGEFICSNCISESFENDKVENENFQNLISTN